MPDIDFHSGFDSAVSYHLSRDLQNLAAAFKLSSNGRIPRHEKVTADYYRSGSFTWNRCAWMQQRFSGKTRFTDESKAKRRKRWKGMRQSFATQQSSSNGRRARFKKIEQKKKPRSHSESWTWLPPKKQQSWRNKLWWVFLWLLYQVKRAQEAECVLVLLPLMSRLAIFVYNYS